MVIKLKADQKQPRRNLFSSFLARSGAGVRSETSSNSATLPLSSVESRKDDLKGPIGLTTIHELPASREVTADIIFIHGLGGGSRKTWCYSSDPDHYWPQSWLPGDKDFIGVRIHVFGYKGDWLERRESILGIHDFGQSLLSALLNHPSIRRADTRIILVGHSMGGCVAKKAYILARQDPAAADIARRVHSMFFLATPHRGSDMAAILESMLAVGWGKKPFLGDLTPNSTVLSAINDTFRHFAPELRLWSFYETVPMRGVGFISRIVVDKHSGTLGYPKEEITAMDADHRQVCKFESPADPNYKLLRNALATAVDLIRATSRSGQGQLSQAHLSPRESREKVSAFLEIRDTPERDLDSLQSLKEPGSCQWFTERPSFRSWEAGVSPDIFWLIGRPGAGKSVLASHAVEYLRTSNRYCSFFIFKLTRSETSTLHHCFRSLAFQMAMQDDTVKRAILQLAQGGISWDETNEISVWRMLFTNCISKLPSVVQHFWVLDGIDECPGFNTLFGKRLLASLPRGLRLLATSRGLGEIERGLESIGPTGVTRKMLSEADTFEDIKLFTTTALSTLAQLQSVEAREYMCEKIVKKSHGSFLWTRLVLQDLAGAWTKEAMDDVLDRLEGHTRNMLLTKSLLTWVVLACRPLTVDELTAAINLDTNETLQTPMKAIPELSGQLLFIDESQQVHVIHETVREFLVSVKDAGVALSVDVRDAHTRLGTLLLKYVCGEAPKPQGARATSKGYHSWVFEKPSVPGRPISTSLMDYACRFFSEHICLGNTKDSQVVDGMCAFFNSDSLLSWIQYIVTKGNLTPIVRTALNLRAYLNVRFDHISTSDEVARVLHDQTTEVMHIAAKFQQQLLSCPSAIYRLIPSLCPPDSMIFRTFCKAPRSSLSLQYDVKGLPPRSWDDCVARVDFAKGRPLTVRYGDSHFAVGLSTGEIIVYDASSSQIVQQLQHPGAVELLESSWGDGLLVSCSTNNLVAWDIKAGTILYSCPLRSRPLAVMSLGTEGILCASERCELTKWSLNSGEHESISWVNIDQYSQTQSHNHLWDTQHKIPISRPSRADFLSTYDGSLLALGYQNAPVFIWDALEVQVVGTVGQEMIPTAGVDCMVFHPNVEIPVLLVAYQPGDLCVYDYNTMETHARRRRTYATAIAGSPHGRTIVVGNAQGAIEVFDLDFSGTRTAILTLIYRSSHPLDDTIRSIALSADGLRFVDVRNRQGRVWAPMGLVRQRSNGEADQRTNIATEMELPELRAAPEISNAGGELSITSPLVPSADGSVIVAGKSDGDVVLFSTADAREILVLYQHTGKSSVISVALVESRNLVISANDAGRVLVAETTTSLSRLASMGARAESNETYIVCNRLFGGGAVSSLMVNGPGDRVLVNGRFAAELWELPSGEAFRLNATGRTNDGCSAQTLPGCSIAVPPTGNDGTATIPQFSFQHPANPDWFVLVTGHIARIYAWADFSELTGQQGIWLARDPPQPSSDSDKTSNRLGSSALSKSSYHLGPGFVVELFREAPLAPPRLYRWPSTAFNPFSEITMVRPTVEPLLESVSPTAIAVLGTIGSATVMFLDVDLWVCSVNLEPGATGPALPSRGFNRKSMSTGTERNSPIQRHFFALSEWRTASGDLRCTVVVPPVRVGAGGGRSRDVVACAAGNRVVVFQGGFQFSEDYANSAV
ncbi:uncharacterized protein B0H64DRAFT_411125 [Chaetomium fimeti]|uniref:GPI inositol-deacylase n=1 Tax=Chaetomium fimeti TaxID=1854472 RepID=A0AAE0H6T1_9PEZI|nr:hypothetical protein B0H64DRAFT_411125 [Chaetomium fimeti]